MNIQNKAKPKASDEFLPSIEPGVASTSSSVSPTREVSEEDRSSDYFIDLSKQSAGTSRSNFMPNESSSEIVLNKDSPVTVGMDCDELELLGTYSDFDCI